MTNLLVVDDNEQDLYLMQVFLEGQGYAVIPAGNGYEALNKARCNPPDMVISDIMMPVMDGYTFCRQWKSDEELKAIPFIFYTATYTDDRDKELAIRLGAARFIIKPTELEVLAEILRDVIGEHKAGKLAVPCEPMVEQIVYYREYNESLVRKLEKKQLELEKARRDLEGDIAKRKQAEIDLKQREQQLLQALQLAHLGSWTYDTITHHSEWSEELFRIFGRDPADGPPAYPEEHQQFIHPDDWHIVEATFQAAAREGKGFYLEVRIIRQDGELRHIITQAQKLRDPDGMAGKLFGTVQDITDRKRAEEAFKTLVSSAPIGIFIVQEGKFKLVNPGFQKITGYGEPELLGKDSLSLVASEFQEIVREKNVRLMQGQSITPFEYQFIHKNGERKWVMESVTPAQYGGETAVLGYFMDITESKQLEAQFLRAQKMEAVGRLAGGVAHDFNNLLTAILGYSEMLLVDFPEDDPRRHYLLEIISTSERASSLTRQLLAFGRKQILQPRILNLNEVISDMEKMLRRLLGEDLDLVPLLDPTLGAVKADPGQMEQVIMNLAVNARDAMARGGLLTIETENVFLDEAYAQDHVEVIPGPYVMLAVSDNGAGMDATTQARIFEPFFTTKEAGKGTGLGLSTVYGIVKQSGGHIWVYSESGKGTTFKIYLPRVEETAFPFITAAVPAASLQGRETILVVEDEKELREVICQALRTYGYTVLEARHGSEAILICARHQGQIHLVLTDVVMPKMNGGQLIERLAPLKKQMKVLFMSGYTEDTASLQGLLAAGVPFLEKPFKMTTLVQKVREVLDTPLTLSL